VADAEAHRAFNRKRLSARNFVIAAGPVANFLFALVAYAVMFMIGVPGLKPIVGEVDPTSAAAAGGLQHGDEIVMVGDRRVQDWDQANLRLLDYAVRADEVTLTVLDRDGREVQRTVPLENRRDLLAEGQFLERLGIRPYRPELQPLIGSVERGSPASEAGLQPGDRVVAVDSEPVDSWAGWVEQIQAAPGERCSSVWSATIACSSCAWCLRKSRSTVNGAAASVPVSMRISRRCRRSRRWCVWARWRVSSVVRPGPGRSAP